MAGIPEFVNRPAEGWGTPSSGDWPVEQSEELDSFSLGGGDGLWAASRLTAGLAVSELHLTYTGGQSLPLGI